MARRDCDWEDLDLPGWEHLHWRAMAGTMRESFRAWREGGRADQWLKDICPDVTEDWAMWCALCREIDRLWEERRVEIHLQHLADDLWKHRRQDLCWLIGGGTWAAATGALFLNGKTLVLVMGMDITWIFGVVWMLVFCLAGSIADGVIPARWPPRITPSQYLKWRERQIR